MSLDLERVFTAEQKLISEARKALEQQLGWRPMVKDIKKKKGRG
ncbi:hypothetical protein [Limnohabitans sp. Rim8]